MHKPYTPAVQKALDELIKSGEFVKSADIATLVESQVKLVSHEIKAGEKEKVLGIRIKAIKASSRLTDEDFITKLLNYGIPLKFMSQFRDEDKVLSRDQVWQHLRDNKLKA